MKIDFQLVVEPWGYYSLSEPSAIISGTSAASHG